MSNVNFEDPTRGLKAALNYISDKLTVTIEQSKDNSKTEIELLRIPAGSFIMGAPDEELNNIWETNQRKVRISKDFFMAKYLTTNAQYQVLMGELPSTKKVMDINWILNNQLTIVPDPDETPEIPVDNISWEKAREFCKRLNHITQNYRPQGYLFNLATEAQWEYACRAGTTTPLNNGKRITVTEEGYLDPNIDEIAWYKENSNLKKHPVGLKKPNAFGLYDMQGNIQEWVLDRLPNQFDIPREVWLPKSLEKFFNNGEYVDPVVPAYSQSRHVVRSNSYYSPATHMSCTSAEDNILVENKGIGFRIVLSSESYVDTEFTKPPIIKKK